MSSIDSVMKEFKTFILKGNIIDMVVGVITGGAFSKVVTSLVNDILMPLLGALTEGTNSGALKCVIHPAATMDRVEVEEAVILYGSLLQDVLDFLIIGVRMFFMAKAVAIISSRLRREEDAREEAPTPAGPTQEELPVEARDFLKGRGDIT